MLAYALTKPGAWLDHPWDEDHSAVKVADKMFVLAGARQTPANFSVRHQDMESREVWHGRFQDLIGPMKYMPNKPWSNVKCSRVPADEIRELVDESYASVVSRLAKKRRPEGWETAVSVV